MLTTAGFMRDIADYLEGVIGPALASAIAGTLQQYPDLANTAIVVLTLLFVYGTIRLIRLAATPAPEPKWTSIDASDARAVAAAFDNLHVLATLARRLGTEVANTEYEFRTQLIAYQRQLEEEEQRREALKVALKARRRQ